MKNQIDTVIQRTQRYWYIDGLAEIAVGVLILILGLFYLLLYVIPNESLAAPLVGIGQPLIILLFWWLGGKSVRALKERITYPRTGYVAYPRKTRKFSRMALAGITGLVVSAAFALVQMALHINQNMIPMLAAAAMALAIAVLGYRFGLVRFYGLALYTLALGVITEFLPLVDLQQNAFLFSLFGLGWIVSGSITFIRYLNSTTPASQEDL
jgi:hypothetical protein